MRLPVLLFLAAVASACVDCSAGVDGEAVEGEGDAEGEGASEGEGEGKAGEGEGEGDGEGEGEGQHAPTITIQVTAATPELHFMSGTPDDRFCVENTDLSISGLLITSCTSGLDCNKTTCGADTATAPPEWDNVPGRSGGDPVLDGSTITVLAMPDGRFVFALGDLVQESATVLIFEDGVLLSELALPLVAGEVVSYFEISCTAGAICLEDLSDGDASDDCP